MVGPLVHLYLSDLNSDSHVQSLSSLHALCLSYSSIVLLRHHDQHSLEEKGFTGAYSFRGEAMTIMVRNMEAGGQSWC